MFKELKNNFNLFLGKFSIREKYVTYIVLFLIFIPYPTYVATKTLFYRKDRAKAQLVGNHFQATLGALLRNVTRLQVMSWSKEIATAEKNAKRSFVKQRITQVLSQMNNKIDSFTVAPLPPVGQGYSVIPPSPPRVMQLTQYWEQLEKLADKEPHSEQTLFAYRRMSNAIQEEMIKIGYSSSLFLPTTPINYYLGQLSLSLLPQSQQFTLELFQRAMKLKYKLGVRERVLEDIEETIDLINTVMGQIETTLTKSIYLARTTEGTMLSPEIILNAEDALIQYKQSMLAYQRIILTDFNMAELTDIVLNVVEAVKTMATFSTDMIEDVIGRKLQRSRRTLSIFTIFMGIFIFILLLFITFRVISNHLVFMTQEISKYAEGDFSENQLIGFNDEFGHVAANFRKIAEVINGVLGNLSKMNNQIGSTSNAISLTLETQGKNIMMQKEGVKKIGIISKEIASNSELLNTEMDKLRISADNLSLESQAREGLDQMKTQMTILSDNSHKITRKLGIVQSKVDTTMGLVNFMGKVGDKAQLLSLNAAIEASVAKFHQKTFLETVEKIQRFASNSMSATKNIQLNIETMSDSATITLEEINKYVNQTKLGSEGLNVVRNNFNSISLQIERQWDEFTNINRMMKIQSTEANTILEALRKLEASVEDNAKIIKNFKRILRKLGVASVAVDRVLKKFKFTNID